MGEYLPLEDQYKEEAKSYFDPKDLTIDTVRSTMNLGEYWINTGWARIGRRGTMEPFHHVGKGQDVTMKAKEMGTIHNKMIRNLKERLDSKSLKLGFDTPDLGQTFKPFIPFGYIYWLPPSYLGPGSEVRHPVVALGRVDDPRYPGHDLIFLSQSSSFIPNLDSKYKDVGLNYFRRDKISEAFFTKNGGFPKRTLGPKMENEKDLHMEEWAREKLFSNMQKNWKERSPKLNFRLQDLGQYNPAAAPSRPKGKDFRVDVGFVFWMQTDPGRRVLVVPVGQVPNSPNDFFVAELLEPKNYLSEKYWKSGKDYFPEEPKPVIRTFTGFEINLWERVVNANWAMVAHKSTLGRHLDVGRDVRMYQDKMTNIFNSMVKSYNERGASQPNKKGRGAGTQLPHKNDGNGRSAGPSTQGGKSST